MPRPEVLRDGQRQQFSIGQHGAVEIRRASLPCGQNYRCNKHKFSTNSDRWIMNKQFVRTDSFVLKKHNLRIYRVNEPNTATVLWTAEQPAIHYVQRLHIKKLLSQKECQ